MGCHRCFLTRELLAKIRTFLTLLSDVPLPRGCGFVLQERGCAVFTLGAFGNARRTRPSSKRLKMSGHRRVIGVPFRELTLLEASRHMKVRERPRTRGGGNALRAIYGHKAINRHRVWSGDASRSARSVHNPGDWAHHTKCTVGQRKHAFHEEGSSGSSAKTDALADARALLKVVLGCSGCVGGLVALLPQSSAFFSSTLRPVTSCTLFGTGGGGISVWL